ncbi:hypothetical protein ACP275_11G037400 [Erythranthe tilingii]
MRALKRCSADIISTSPFAAARVITIGLSIIVIIFFFAEVKESSSFPQQRPWSEYFSRQIVEIVKTNNVLDDLFFVIEDLSFEINLFETALRFVILNKKNP